MEKSVPDYFLRRITKKDTDLKFKTGHSRFDRDINNILEEDIISSGKKITYLFFRDNFFLGIFRYYSLKQKKLIGDLKFLKALSLKDIEKINNKISKEKWRIIEINRIGIEQKNRNKRWGILLRAFAYAHLGNIEKRFLMVIYVTEEHYLSMEKNGELEFFEYKSERLIDDEPNGWERFYVLLQFLDVSTTRKRGSNILLLKSNKLFLRTYLLETNE